MRLCNERKTYGCRSRIVTKGVFLVRIAVFRTPRRILLRGLRHVGHVGDNAVAVDG